jgi:hypothetical protein
MVEVSQQQVWLQDEDWIPMRQGELSHRPNSSENFSYYFSSVHSSTTFLDLYLLYNIHSLCKWMGSKRRMGQWLV